MATSWERKDRGSAFAQCRNGKQGRQTREKPMTTTEIQSAFIWTKIQADSGQSIDRVLNRKELERQSGNTFWWGIGESKADQIRLLLTRNPRPLVLFSLMLSRPHRRDSHPDGVLLWEA